MATAEGEGEGGRDTFSLSSPSQCDLSPGPELHTARVIAAPSLSTGPSWTVAHHTLRGSFGWHWHTRAARPGDYSRTKRSRHGGCAVPCQPLRGTLPAFARYLTSLCGVPGLLRWRIIPLGNILAVPQAHPQSSTLTRIPTLFSSWKMCYRLPVNARFLPQVFLAPPSPPGVERG
jgi:hypothetical protein